MFTLSIESPDEAPRSLRIDEFPCLIGRSVNAHLVLSGWRVAREHSRIELQDGILRVVDGGSLSGTLVNGERVVEYGPLAESDEILIAGHRLRVLALPHTASHPGVPGPTSHAAGSGRGSASQSGSPQTNLRFVWRRLLHRRLISELDARRQDLGQLSGPQLRIQARSVLEQVIASEADLPAELDRSDLLTEVLDEAVGLGPLEALMADESVSEIMVNGTAPIHVERHGLIEPTGLAFSSEEAIRLVIDRIIAPLGRHVDEGSPMVDARLSDGSRLNAVIPPLSLSGSAITIRRFNRQLLAAEDLLASGTLSAAMLAFLRLCVESRRNIVVSGGTGAGKTTLLNLLADSIGESERVITIEDAAELRLRHRNLVSLEARPANAEGRGLVSIRDLLRNALRMRPDRIVIGECRGGEALDMLQAMNTGHDGSITTVHANSPRDALSRIEVMALMSGVDIPLQAVREQIAAAVDVVVQQARMPDGGRKVIEIAEVSGIESGRILMQTIFRFEPSTGAHFATGQTPHFLDSFHSEKAAASLRLFGESA